MRLLSIILLLSAVTGYAKIDSLVYVKSENSLKVYSGKKLIKDFYAVHGSMGRKKYEGDGKTPEGAYWLSGRNYGSIAYRSIRISYPSAGDKKAGRTGSDIMVHGNYNHFGDEFPKNNWTLGCIATPNKNMDWLFKYLPKKVRIYIRP